MVHIKQAGIEDIETIIPLFTAYRTFYKVESDPAQLRSYLYPEVPGHHISATPA